MQHYLLDSSQRLNVSFSKGSVAAYYHCFNQPHNKEIPPLVCASLWSRFDLFKEHVNNELVLTKSVVNQAQKIKVSMMYVGHLEDTERRQARSITCYAMVLILIKNDQHVIAVTQAFIKTIKQR